MKKSNSVVDIFDFVADSIQQYTYDIQEQIKEEIKNVGEKILAEIKITCPISNKHLTKRRHLKDYFVFKIKLTKDKIIGVIYATKQYQIIHLLEYGYINHWNNEKINPRPFLRNAYNKYIDEYIKKNRNYFKILVNMIINNKREQNINLIIELLKNFIQIKKLNIHFLNLMKIISKTLKII
ncbi:HK97 gp10 family phage protein [Spiroplasma citri]|uniref:Phage protein n=1 Tax=Spiroplasma citri TaxID=2133 RepID=A0AAJ4EKI7_SPICI|nr:hypothetical protein [Spiroplasma citri]APE75387.1 hypothetical protein SCITRI_001512 [Spiroplasma citri]QIA67601.1 hypothetical protein GMI18_08290 [Spiroplasma citri]QIA69451.1 hypothetical protein GL298_08210 [Spiroplasma citri]QIA71315.1 hypothetical protein GL981_08245 [Spiroplasma citri]QIA73449.1 hypothetical protein GL982_07520 [Spiroplasma citri]